MENKYNELEKLKALKDTGTITGAEFEIQKYKILNTTTETKVKKNKSKIFFIISSVGIGISIILGIIYYFWQSTLWFDIWIENNKNMAVVETISNILIGSLILFGLASIILLVLGIIIKGKGEIKNVK